MLLQKHTICRTIFVDLRCGSAYNCPNGTPGPEIGRAGETGAIADGLPADFVVCGEALERRAVYLGGVRL